MNGERWIRMQQLFEQALCLAPAERMAFVRRACGDDAELRSELESLLEHDSRADERFLAPPEQSRAAVRAVMAYVESREPEDVEEAPDPLIGQRIGRYQIRARIAAGGMATVYEAVQERPHRIVALKVLKPHVADRSVVWRFEFEAQVLARLQHPHVAQVFEAGTYELAGGQVLYFAMEYIPGAQDIVEYASQKRLDTRQRLELFTRVCDAVHHGHTRGVIHRDIKPANILVDSDGEPKVIDFGVARATDSDLALTTQQTQVGQLVGTIQYMSPEQCDADPHDIDTRSDVYSLGVVLYELLSGELPYEATGSTIYRATPVIKEHEPRRLGSADPRLRGDLETIVHKALEKDRDRRYASAAELAADIRRYLNGEPIAARPPSAWYVLRKFAGRHRAACAGAVVVLMVLVGAAAVSSGFALAARRAERLARLRAYTSRLSAAQGAWSASDPATARRLLELTEPELRGWEWRHLYARMDQSLGVAMLLADRFRDLALDPAGRRCAVVSGENGAAAGVVVLDLSSGRQVARLPFGPGEPGCVAAWDSDGVLLALACQVRSETSGVSTIISLWDTSSSDNPKLVARWRYGNSGPHDLAFHPAADVLAVGLADGELGLWDLSDPSRLPNDPASRIPADIVLTGLTRIVWTLAFSPDGRWLAAGSADNLICVWDIERALAGRGVHKPAMIFAGHSDHVLSLAFSRDGRQLASGSVDGTIRLWDFAAAARTVNAGAELPISPGRTLGVLTGHAAPVYAVAFDPSGERLISGGGDRTIRIWDVRAAAPVADARGQRFFGASRRRLINTLRGHDRAVRRLAVLPDGRVVSGSEDGTIRLWAQDVEDVPRLREHFTSVCSVAFTPDGRYAISGGGGNDDGVVFWDPRTAAPVSRTYLRFGETVAGVACWRGADGVMWVAAATARTAQSQAGGRLLIWQADERGRPGRRVASIDWVLTGPPVNPDYRGYCSLACSADGTRLAAGDTEGFITVWDVSDPASPRQIARMQGGQDETSALTFLDAAGAWLVSGQGKWIDLKTDQQHPIELWDVDRATAAETHAGHTGSVLDAALSPQGDLLATASHDHTVRLWTVRWRGGVPHIRPAGILKGHASPVDAVTFHPTERRLFSGARDGTIKVWDYGARAEVATLRGHRGPVKRLSFSPDGRVLASASGGQYGADNVVWLWEAPRDASGDAKPPSASDSVDSGGLRYERAVAYRARDAVWELFQMPVHSLDEARARLADPQQVPLPDDVRRFALEHFELLLPHPRWFWMRAEPVAQTAGLPRERYRQALIWARVAAAMAPENEGYRQTVAALARRAAAGP